MANRYFSSHLSRQDVAWTFAALRPLLADPKDRATSVTRDYVLDVNTQGAPLLSIYGGKLTTYRKLAEDVLDLIAPRLGCTAPHWTAGAPLPGGDMPDADFAAFLAAVEARHPWLPPTLRQRYARLYGTRVERLLQGTTAIADLGEEVLPGLHAREIDYLRDEEWAVDAEDILYRRTKLGLHVPPDGAARLDAWLAAHPRLP
jgi:glycerol-3-phosphate dehydrogenase